ncbi:XdhC family protein [Calditrichota bacterium LG25]
MKEIYQKLAEAIEQNRSGVLLTVIDVKGSSPGKMGGKMLVFEDGEHFGTVGGGQIEYLAIQEALANMSRNAAWRNSYVLSEDAGMLCGGKVEILYEPFGQKEKLIIFGAGHVGSALADLAPKANFYTTVVDNRPEYAREERLPAAHRVLCGDYPQVFEELRFDENTYIMVMTHGHGFDQIIADYCLKQPFKYLGVIGSRKKARTFFKELKEAGHTQEEIARVFMPVGFDIGAETPFEIAISIMAELIAVRYEKPLEGRSLKKLVAKKDVTPHDG